jgi:membrane fusion protein (multidrug efflux system)
MNPIVFVMRRPIRTLMVVVALASGGVLGLSKMGVDLFPALNAPKVFAYLGYVGKGANQVKDYVVGKYESYFHAHKEEAHEEQRKVVVTSPKVMDVTITQPYVCQIHSQNHIEIQALDSGYLEEIVIKEGQAVKKGDLMFRLKPVLYKAKAAAEKAEADLAQLKYNNTQMLNKTKVGGQPVVSDNEVLLHGAERDKAKAKADLAQAELDFTDIRAPFDGIVDRQRQQPGSFIKEGEVLTTLSDNSLMWVFFNVPEKQYLEYMAARKRHEPEGTIELRLANQDKFPESCVRLTIEAQFDNTNGNIPFRADFPNPERLLRHGQTGTILIRRTLKNALVIPQRATFERLDKRYVWVVGEDDVVVQRLITIKHELDDVFVIDSGLDVKDKIVLQGIRDVKDGEKVKYEFRQPEEAVTNQKFRAE